MIPMLEFFTHKSRLLVFFHFSIPPLEYRTGPGWNLAYSFPVEFPLGHLPISYLICAMRFRDKFSDLEDLLHSFLLSVPSSRPTTEHDWKDRRNRRKKKPKEKKQSQKNISSLLENLKEIFLGDLHTFWRWDDLGLQVQNQLPIKQAVSNSPTIR